MTLILPSLNARQDHTFDSPLAYENVLYQSIIEAGYDRHVTFFFTKGYYLWAMWTPNSPDAHILEEKLSNVSSQNQTSLLKIK